VSGVASSEEVRAEVTSPEEQFSWQELDLAIANDMSVFSLEAVDAVMFDLILAVLLVSIVMLFFLQSLRDSFIVLLSIPDSLISTLIAMYLFGFSLNLLMLF